MRFISIAAGTGTILITALIAIRISPQYSEYSKIIPAALVATNPYLIQFSARARSYSALVLFAALLWLMFLRWRELPSWSNSIWLTVCCLLVVLIHLNGTFVVMWLVVVIILEVLRTLRKPDKLMLLWLGIKRLTIPFTFCMGIAGFFYFQLLRYGLISYYAEWSIRGFTSIDYIPSMFTLYFGTKSMSWIFLILLLAGTLRTFRHDPYKLSWILLWIFTPIIAASVLGYHYPPTDFSRLFIFTVPGILILSAIGIEGIVSLFGKRVRQWVLPLCVVGIILAQSSTITQEFQESKLRPYHKAFAYIKENWRNGDKIFSFEWLTYLHIRPYLECRERMVEGSEGIPPFILENTTAGRIFLLSSNKESPSFGVETANFGLIRVSILPPEPKTERYARLLSGFEQIEKALPKNSLRYEHIPIYESLACLAKFRGDEKMARFYESISEETMNSFILKLEKQKNRTCLSWKRFW